MFGGTIGNCPEGNCPGSVIPAGFDWRKPLGVTYGYLQEVCKISMPLSKPWLECILILQEVIVQKTTVYPFERQASILPCSVWAYSNMRNSGPNYKVEEIRISRAQVEIKVESLNWPVQPPGCTSCLPVWGLWKDSGCQLLHSEAGYKVQPGQDEGHHVPPVQMETVRLSLERVAYLLREISFIPPTDSRCIKVLPVTKEACEMWARWSAYLCSPNFKTVHRSGSKQINKDCLSRLQDVPVDDQNTYLFVSLHSEEDICHVHSPVPALSISHLDLRKAVESVLSTLCTLVHKSIDQPRKRRRHWRI